MYIIIKSSLHNTVDLHNVSQNQSFILSQEVNVKSLAAQMRWKEAL